MGRHRAHGEEDAGEVTEVTEVTEVNAAGDAGEALDAADAADAADGKDAGPARRGRRSLPEDAEAEHPGRALLARLLAEAADRGADRGEGAPQDGRPAGEAAPAETPAADRGPTVEAEPEPEPEPEPEAEPEPEPEAEPEPEPEAEHEPQAGPERVRSLDRPAAAGGQPERARRESATSADLRLLRQDSRLRLRCALAALAPFVAFTAILLGLQRADVYLIWVWIPTVTAGVLVGALLDRAHGRRDGSAGRDGPPASDGVAAREPTQLPAGEERDDAARKAG